MVFVRIFQNDSMFFRIFASELVFLYVSRDPICEEFVYRYLAETIIFSGKHYSMSSLKILIIFIIKCRSNNSAVEA